MAAAVSSLLKAASRLKSPAKPRSPDSASAASSNPSASAALPSVVHAYYADLAQCIVDVPPNLGKARVPTVCRYRDKESMLGEIIDLKEALGNIEIHLNEHRHLYLKALQENRRLEKRCEELELRGNLDAPRTGGVVRLECRAKGLEAQYELLSDTVATRKHGELYQLARDLQATRTRETEVERDVIAAEITRLKWIFNHMQMLHQQAQEENDDYKFCKRRAASLEAINPKVAGTLEALKAYLQKAKDDIKACKVKGDEAALDAKRWASKTSALESKMEDLMSGIRNAQEYKKKMLRKAHQVGFNRMQFNRQFKEEHPNVPIAH